MIDEIIILAQDDGNVILSNLSAISSGKEFLIQYPMLSLWKLNQEVSCHFTSLARQDYPCNVYIGKLTCLNLKVFTEILRCLETDLKQQLGISTKTEKLCQTIVAKMREASVDSFQELDRTVQVHGAATILKFLNSESTGAKEALQFDAKFPDVVGIVCNPPSPWRLICSTSSRCWRTS